MNNKLKRTIAVVLSTALMLGGIGTAVYSLNATKTTDETTEVSGNQTDKKEDLTKDETVYVLAGSDGSVEKIIVSDWIKNSINSSSITDDSQLKDIENVKGNESYTINSDNMKVWDAQGNDIYYQGNIEKTLPVNLSVSYKLNGNNIKADEIAGKSGKVTIRFDYKNNQSEVVSIDGKDEQIYVPFAMLTGMLLSTDNFSNVDVTNGKLINDGSHIAVVGIAFPGLQNNLNITKDKFDIPEYVEITADVKNFEMDNTVTIATNSIFNNIDTKKLDSLDELTNSLGELNKAMSQLMDGSSQLYGGLCTLLDKSSELVQGVNQLSQGAEKLKNGAGELDSGVNELSDGAKTLTEGLGKLTENNDALKAGSDQVFNSLLSIANKQLKDAGLTVPELTKENYATVLNGVIASLDQTNVAAQAQATARETVTQAVNAQKDQIKAAVSAEVEKGVTQKVIEQVRIGVETKVLASLTPPMTKEDYDAAVAAGLIPQEKQNQISAVIEQQMATDLVKATINANVEQQMKTDDVTALISSKTDEQVNIIIEQKMNSQEVQEKITQALEQAKSGAASISVLKEQLDSYNQFYTGLDTYTSGVASAKSGADKLNAGAEKLKRGTAELNAGMTELYNGILTLKNGTPALTDGVTALRDGSMKLSSGLKEFNEKGIKKLTDAVGDNVTGLITRVKATVDVSKDYKSFSGLSDDMNGQVKFIYRTDEIKTK